MEKIILSKSVAVALEKALKSHSENKELILKNHFDVSAYDYKEWTGTNLKYLNELSLEQMAIALYVGYEVKETPEEKLLKIFLENEKGYDRTDEKVYQNENEGILIALNTLGIKIEGINA